MTRISPGHKETSFNTKGPNCRKLVWSWAALAVISMMFAGGCALPIAKTSKLMDESAPPPEAPPEGKSLVCIHRPKSGAKLYTTIWDRVRLIGDLGNGHSLAYVCEPGKHYFINRSVQRTGVVDAELLPGKTYDLWVAIKGTGIVSFELEPVKPGSKERGLVAQWSQENRWVSLRPSAATTDDKKVGEIEDIIRDFTTGRKQARLQHLASTDFR
jgi:hypothetical protein